MNFETKNEYCEKRMHWCREHLVNVRALGRKQYVNMQKSKALKCPKRAIVLGKTNSWSFSHELLRNL